MTAQTAPVLTTQPTRGGIAPSPQPPLCTHCGADRDEAFQTLSRHRTSTGITIWLRCTCGALQVRVVGAAGTRIAARGCR
ncbi:hypothetical protein [Streptomyces xiaopingdaonensis]|uniref:hypothetical protein n=1 Tax=Streptomyces xiaopingdaonensis TaxID=1565415 RepID=UPI00030951B4|nr:hypothetical protein [Streptomyces xiaopingdaonensis]